MVGVEGLHVTIGWCLFRVGERALTSCLYRRLVVVSRGYAVGLTCLRVVVLSVGVTVHVFLRGS